MYLIFVVSLVADSTDIVLELLGSLKLTFDILFVDKIMLSKRSGLRNLKSKKENKVVR